MIEIKPLSHCDGEVTIPGSKSYTHRALLISALADGESLLQNVLCSEDTGFTARALQTFGIEVVEEGDSWRVRGMGGRLKEGEAEIYVGNSGTSMRFLTALAALRRGRTRLDGSPRMRMRPVRPLLASLVDLGAAAHSQDGTGNPPVIVESRGGLGGKTRIRGNESSQFISALLMVAPLAQKDVRVEVVGPMASRPYVEMTLDIMKAFGAEVEIVDRQTFWVKAGQGYASRRYGIEGDASNASYFFAAAAVTGGKVRVNHFRPDSIQGDVGFLDILEKMGCEVFRGEGFAEVRGKELRGIEIDMNAMPDLVPTLAVSAIFARGETVIRNIAHLRLKESDRVRALAAELSKMGAQVEEGRDYLKLAGGNVRGTEIETYQDHRMAMSFAVAGLRVPGIRIRGERCVEKSFPGFWEEWEKLYGKDDRRPRTVDR
jgi:3-phosphoshikimate 1-carboxyvinyltransferase